MRWNNFWRARNAYPKKLRTTCVQVSARTWFILRLKIRLQASCRFRSPHACHGPSGINDAGQTALNSIQSDLPRSKVFTTYIDPKSQDVWCILYTFMNTMSIGKETDTIIDPSSKHGNVEEVPNDQQEQTSRHAGYRLIYTWICIVLLFVNYFLAQYDKFILSYFSTHLSETIGL